jgi:hypothetical protein
LFASVNYADGALDRRDRELHRVQIGFSTCALSSGSIQTSDIIEKGFVGPAKPISQTPTAVILREQFAMT